MCFRDQASFTLLKTQTKNKTFFSPNPPRNTGNFSAFLHGGFPQPTSLPKTPRSKPVFHQESSVKDPCLLVLHGLRFAHNVGAALRCSQLLGAQGTLLLGGVAEEVRIFCQTTLTAFKGSIWLLMSHMYIFTNY